MSRAARMSEGVQRVFWQGVWGLSLSLACGLSLHGEAVRIKDLGKLKGWRENALVGYGVVTGLAGTGDSPSSVATRQALSNILAQFDLTVPADQIQSRNVAVVMASASLPPFARVGDALDVTVTSAGDARSLVGGSLLLAPLKGANGKTYALAEGPLSVGGYRYDSNGNVVQKNHPTVGSIPNGAKVEIGVQASLLGENQTLTFVLNDPDFTTANTVSTAINARMGGGLAKACDAEGIDIRVPQKDQENLVAFVARIEALSVEPDRRARVVINERTGTVVSGGDVRISKVAISHGDIKITISQYTTASQPFGNVRSGAGVQTALVTNTTMDAVEPSGPGFVPPGSSTVADLIQTLYNLKANTRDVISILRAIKAAGALHAELVVQ